MLIFNCTITDVFERLINKYVSGAGKESIFTTASAGWYVQVDHRISICVGKERPSFNPGDSIELILRKK